MTTVHVWDYDWEGGRRACVAIPNDLLAIFVEPSGFKEAVIQRNYGCQKNHTYFVGDFDALPGGLKKVSRFPNLMPPVWEKVEEDKVFRCGISKEDATCRACGDWFFGACGHPVMEMCNKCLVTQGWIAGDRQRWLESLIEKQKADQPAVVEVNR